MGPVALAEPGVALAEMGWGCSGTRGCGMSVQAIWSQRDQATQGLGVDEG